MASLNQDDAETKDRSVEQYGRWILRRQLLDRVDLISPHVQDPPTDSDWQTLFEQLDHSPFGTRYDHAIIDSPPSLGPRSRLLFKSCDEVVIVLRAEPMAYRTLPSFLQLLKDTHKQGNALRLRGILLTLPAGEVPGGVWESEFRRCFGERILKQVISHDSAVGQALLQGKPVVLANPKAVTAQQYTDLAATLGLLDRQPFKEVSQPPRPPMIVPIEKEPVAEFEPIFLFPEVKREQEEPRELIKVWPQVSPEPEQRLAVKTAPQPQSSRDAMMKATKRIAVANTPVARSNVEFHKVRGWLSPWILIIFVVSAAVIICLYGFSAIHGTVRQWLS